MQVGVFCPSWYFLALPYLVRKYNKINPEVIIVVHEIDPRIAALLAATKVRRREANVPEGRVRNKSVPPKKSETPGQDIATAEASESDVAEIEPSADDEESAIKAETPVLEELLVESPNGVHDESLSNKNGLDGEEKRQPIRDAVSDAQKKGETRKDPSSKTTIKTGKRRGRPRKKPVAEEQLPPLSDLILAPKNLLEERRRKNPRERPVPGADVEYG